MASGVSRSRAERDRSPVAAAPQSAKCPVQLGVSLRKLALRAGDRPHASDSAISSQLASNSDSCFPAATKLFDAKGTAGEAATETERDRSPVAAAPHEAGCLVEPDVPLRAGPLRAGTARAPPLPQILRSLRTTWTIAVRRFTPRDAENRVSLRPLREPWRPLRLVWSHDGSVAASPCSGPRASAFNRSRSFSSTSFCASLCFPALVHPLAYE